MDQQIEELPDYKHIDQNDFSYRKHKKQKEEDIAICECKYDASHPDSACREGCLNVLTSTECTPGYCPCGESCKNQRFQKCEYAKTKLFRTEGRGWGLLAAENIHAGQFVIEYCGEVISWKEAKRRSHKYETQGLKDAYIISLNASESIDATRKGSIARFINHSCQPNCETRKWTVLGEIRVGIFAKQDIPISAELSYDYNFEWYGGAKVRCLCGASGCSEFLGAKSRGFQEDTYLWEDDDDRYSVEQIPLYDSAEDEPSSKMMDVSPRSEHPTVVFEPLDSTPMNGAVVNELKIEAREVTQLFSQDNQTGFSQKNSTVSRIRTLGPSPGPKKRLQTFRNGRSKNIAQKIVNARAAVALLASKVAQDEILKNEEMKNDATSQLEMIYDEIRPAIEEHERDSQDSVSTIVAEKWIGGSCTKLKADFDLYSSIIKNIACTPRRSPTEPKPSQPENENEVKCLTN